MYGATHSILYDGFEALVDLHGLGTSVARADNSTGLPSRTQSSRKHKACRARCGRCSSRRQGPQACAILRVSRTYQLGDRALRAILYLGQVWWKPRSERTMGIAHAERTIRAVSDQARMLKLEYEARSGVNMSPRDICWPWLARYSAFSIS